MKPGVPNQERLLQQLLDDRKRFVSDATAETLLAFKLTFETEHGRRVLADLDASYGGISFVPGYSDVTAFKEGRRSVCDDIRTMLKMAEVLHVVPPPPQSTGR